MAGSIRVIKDSIPEIKFFSRGKTQGEEIKMVEQYVEYIVKTNKRTKTKLAIFYEPQLEFGYPDIVIIEYANDDKVVWNQARETLNNSDLKILYEIYRVKSNTISGIASVLGYTNNEMTKHIKNLEEAQLIKVQKGKVYRQPLNSNNCIKKIIAIEAKIDKWNSAINQARNSSIFASEVYVLLNKKSCNEKIVNKCASDGLGIILMNGRVEKILKAKTNTLPSSYISLLFNEWIQRIERGRMANK